MIVIFIDAEEVVFTNFMSVDVLIIRWEDDFRIKLMISTLLDLHNYFMVIVKFVLPISVDELAILA